MKNIIKCFCFFILLSAGSSCSNNNPTTPTGDTFTWSNISPSGGFVSSVQFHPNISSEIWASGDDSGGLYRSTNGGNSWILLTTPPPDHSTYSLAFDPSNPLTLYAPNHFGRGLLKTINGGTSWSILGSGLPITNPEKRVHDTAVDPNNTSDIYVGTAGGLFKSTDSGATFTQIVSGTFGGEIDFRSIAVLASPTTRIFVGTANGRVYDSIDNGSTWTEITTVNFQAVSDLAVSANALYMGFEQGHITKTASFNTAGLTVINDASGPGDIESGWLTKLAVIDGLSAATDRLYIGTVYKAGSAKWGFFESIDGGATYTKRVTGLNNESIFSMTVNPSDSNNIILGTINGGIYKTIDAGVNWNDVSTGVVATDSFAFAEDPFDSNHLLMSSSAGLTGTSKVFETIDGGTSWSEVASLADKDVMSSLVSPADSLTVIIGTFTNGIYKSTAGAGGPWTNVLNRTIGVSRLKVDAVNNDVLYGITEALISQVGVDAERGVYVSADNGDNWTLNVVKTAYEINTVTPHPVNSEEALAVGSDVISTTDRFVSTPVSLGLAVFAPGKFFTSAMFDPSNPSILFVGSSTGELYKTSNYSPAGPVTWVQVPHPATSISIHDIQVDSTTGAIYLACWTADLSVKADSTPGLLKSIDGGASWTYLNSGLFPSRLIWKFRPSPTVSNRYYGGLWGGGFMRFED